MKDEKNYVTKKYLKDSLDDMVAQIAQTLQKIIDNMATKDDLKKVEKRLGSVEEELSNVKSDVKQIKRDVTDLKADTPTPQEFDNHEKRISKLEKTVYAS